MIRGLVYGIKKFWSEITSGDLLILFLSIVLAVTAISSVGFLGDRLQSSMKERYLLFCQKIPIFCLKAIGFTEKSDPLIN